MPTLYVKLSETTHDPEHINIEHMCPYNGLLRQIHSYLLQAYMLYVAHSFGSAKNLFAAFFQYLSHYTHNSPPPHTSPPCFLRRRHHNQPSFFDVSILLGDQLRRRYRIEAVRHGELSDVHTPKERQVWVWKLCVRWFESMQADRFSCQAVSLRFVALYVVSAHPANGWRGLRRVQRLRLQRRLHNDRCWERRTGYHTL